jgi:hypothetical protein
MMELKLSDKVAAAIEINNEPFLNFENSVVYENIEKNEAFLYIKSADPSINKEAKIRFLKK